MSKISAENKVDEDADYHEGRDDPGHAARSGRVIKLHDFAKHFPETAHAQFSPT